MIEPIKVEFDCPTTYGIAYIEWYHHPEESDYYLRLARYELDTGWREVCVGLTKSELRKVRDAIDETFEDIAATKSNRVDFYFDRGIAYIRWDHYPEVPNHYFLRLYDWWEDTGHREVCVKITPSELENVRDAINRTLEDEE